MTGVAIELETKSSSAERALADINRSLIALVQNSSSAKVSLQKLTGGDFKGISKGANEANDAVGKLNASGGKIEKSFLSPIKSVASALTSLPVIIGTITAGFAAMGGAMAVFANADALTNMNNRLRLVIDSSENLAVVQQKLFRLSQETRQETRGSVELYANIARALKGTNASSQDLLNTTKTIQQAVSLSGASAQSAAAGLAQFNQSLASGVFRGEEFNSVMEQIPRLAMVIADGLGVSIGALRGLASQGKLTTSVLIDAIHAQAGIINKEFTTAASTAASGFKTLTSAISNFFQVGSSFSGTNAKVGGFLQGLAGSVNKMSSQLTPALYIAIQGIRNYIASFEDLSKNRSGLTGFFFTKFKFLDNARFSQEYLAVQSTINTFLTFLGLKRKEVEKGFVIGGIQLPNIKEQLRQFKEFFVEPPQAKNLADHFKTVVRVVVAAGDAVAGLTSKFKYLIPDIRGPLTAMRNAFTSFFDNTQTDTLVFGAEFALPILRAIENVMERGSLFILGDHRIERAFVNMFKSSSLDDFVKSLYAIGDAGRSTRFSGINTLLNDWKFAINGMILNMKGLSSWLGITDARLIAFNNIRLDRIKEGLEIVGSVIKRLATDVLFPNFGSQIQRVYSQLRAVSVAVAAGLKDNLSFRLGEEMGQNVVYGIINAIVGLGRGIADAIASVFRAANKSTFSLSIKENGIADSIKTSLTAVFVYMAGFITGVLEGALISVGVFFQEVLVKAIDGIGSAFRAMIRKAVETYEAFKVTINRSIGIGYTLNFDATEVEKGIHRIYTLFNELTAVAIKSLGKTFEVIKSFGRSVNNVFFDIYDKVVGHSYWPDMVDGVNDYTKNLFRSTNTLENFREKVNAIFKSMANYFAQSSFGARVIEVYAKLSVSSLDTLGKTLTEVLSTALVTALLFAFGGSTGRLIAIDFTLSTFGIGLHKIFGSAPTALVSALGDSAGIITSTIIGSFVNALDGIVAALPAFWHSFLSGLGPVGKAISTVFAAGPQNTLLYAGLTGLALYAARAEGGLQRVRTLLLGLPGEAGRNGTWRTPPVAGIMDYGASFLGVSRKAAIPGMNPALALAGMAAVSTAALSSISLIESSLVGVPMIIFGLLGREAGARLLQEPFKFFWNLTKGLQASATGPRVISALSGAASDFGAQVKQMYRNVRANTEAYGKGAIGLVDMFTQDRSTPGFISTTSVIATATKLAKEVGASLGRFKINGVAVSDMASEGMMMAATYWKGFKNASTPFAKDIWASIQFIWQNGGTALTNTLTPLKAIFAEVFSGVKAGLTGLFAFVSSKLGIFVLLAAGVATFASAANTADASGASFTDTLKEIGVLIAQNVIGMYAFGKAVQAFQAFQAGSKAFKVNAGEAAGNTAATAATMQRAAAAASAAHALSPVAVREAAMASAAAGARQAAVARASSQAVGIGAGFASVGAFASQSVKDLGDFFSSIFTNASKASKAIYDVANTIYLAGSELFKSTILAKGFWVSLGEGAVGAWRGMLAGASAVLGVFVSIKEAIRDVIKSMLAMDAVGSFKTFKTTVVEAISLFRSFGAGIALQRLAAGTMFEGLAAAIAGAGAATVALGAGIAVGVGAIALWAFGPGDTFMDNLVWVGDKIKGIFGMKPSSNVGRKGSLEALLGDANLGGQEVSFKPDIRGIDFSAIKAQDFAYLEKSAQTTKEALDRLKEVQFIQGRLTAEQLAEFKKVTETQKTILRQQVQLPEQSFRESTMANYEELTKTTTTWYQRIGNLFSPVTEGIAEGLHSVSNFFGDVWDLFVVNWWPVSLPILGLIEAVKLVFMGLGNIFSWIGAGFTAIGDMWSDSNIISNIADGLSIIGVTASAHLKKLGKDFVKYTENKPSAIRGQAAASLADSSAGLLRYADGVTPEAKARLQKMQAEYTENTIALDKLTEELKKNPNAIGDGRSGAENVKLAERALRRLEEDSMVASTKYKAYRDRGFKDSENPYAEGATAAAKAVRDYKKNEYENARLYGPTHAAKLAELEALQEKQKLSGMQYAAMSAEGVQTAKRLSLAKQYTLDTKNIVDKFSAYGKDFGENLSKFNGDGDNKGLLKLSGIAMKRELILTKFKDGVGSDAERLEMNVALKVNSREFDRVYDLIQGSVFFKEGVELKVKLSGSSSSFAAAANAYVMDPAIYKAWQDAMDKVIAAKNALEDAQNTGDSQSNRYMLSAAEDEVASGKKKGYDELQLRPLIQARDRIASRIAKGSTSPAKILQLSIDAAEADANLSKHELSNGNFKDVTEGFSKAGLPAVSNSFFLGKQSDSYKELTGVLNEAVAAKLRFETPHPGDTWADSREALSTMVSKLQLANELKHKLFEDIKKDPTVNALTKQKLTAELSGVTLSDNLAGSKLAGKARNLSDIIAKTALERGRLNAIPGGLTANAANDFNPAANPLAANVVEDDQVQARIAANARRQLNRLEELASKVRTVSDLINATAAGITLEDLPRISQGNLSIIQQAGLANLALDDQLAHISATASKSQIDEILSAKFRNTAKAVKAAMESLGESASSMDKLLSNFGVTTGEQASKLSPKFQDAVVTLEKVKQNMDSLLKSGTIDSAVYQRYKAQYEKAREDLTELIDQSLTTKVGKANDVFNLGFTDATYSDLGAGLESTLSKYAGLFKAKLTEIQKGGFATTSKSFFDAMTKAVEGAEFISVFQKAGTIMANALSGSFKTRFAAYEATNPSNALDRNTFKGLSNEKQKSLIESQSRYNTLTSIGELALPASVRKQYEDGVNSGADPKQLIEDIKQALTAGFPELMKDFEETLETTGKPAEDATKALVDINTKLYDSIQALAKSISELLDKALGGRVKEPKPEGYATGGHIYGPGTGTSDEIPAMLSNGEFVINAKAAKKHRRLLETINSGKNHFALGTTERLAAQSSYEANSKLLEGTADAGSLVAVAKDFGITLEKSLVLVGGKFKDKLQDMMQSLLDAKLAYAHSPADARLKAAYEKQLQATADFADKRFTLYVTQATQAGANMAANLAGYFTDGMKGLLKTGETSALTAKSAGLFLAEKIVDNFVDGLSSAVFKKGGMFDKVLSSIGVGGFDLGAMLGGGNGDDNTMVAATLDLTAAMKDLIETMSGDHKDKPVTRNRDKLAADRASSKAPRTVEELFAPLTRGFSKIFDPIKETFNNGLGLLTGGVLGNKSTKSKGDAEDPLATLPTTFSTAWEGLSGTLSTSWNSFSSILSGSWDSFGSLLSDNLGSMSSMFSDIGSSIAGMLGGGGGGGGIGGALFDVASLFLADGGHVSGPGTGTSDSIPAMLSNGEFVVNAASTRRFGPLLHQINSGNIPAFAAGGLIGGGLIGAGANPFTAPMKGSIASKADTASKQEININITGDISRQTRKEIYEMLPTIANGVNSHNREKGYRG